MIKKRLILFTRYPQPGAVKTRLIPALGAAKATELHRRLVLRTLRTAHAAALAVGVTFEIHFDGGSEEAMRHWLGDHWVFRRQPSGDLGKRMAAAFEMSSREGSAATVLIGSDCPALCKPTLLAAFERLSESPVVLGPANDGGYYLIGLTRMLPELFQGIPWGSDSVLSDSCIALKRLGLKPALLEPLDDLDRPQDLPAWEQRIRSEHNDLRRISVVVPTLNEADQLPRTLECVSASQAHEIIVADAGSQDETCRLAAQAGCKVLPCRPSRARQMNSGAALATGDAILFLHGDTLLPTNWQHVVARTLQRPDVAAGAFRFCIAENFRGKLLIQWGTNFRSRWLQQPYGDQALFLRRSLFEELGGYADLPFLEDYELIRRLRKRGRIVTAAETATTSGRRWVRLGCLRTTLVNRLVISGYRLGVSPAKLFRFYTTQTH